MATTTQIAAISFHRLACLTLAPQSIAILLARGLLLSNPVGVPSHLRLPGVLCHLHENNGAYVQLDGASYLSSLRDPSNSSRQITSLEAYFILEEVFEADRAAFLQAHYSDEQVDQIVAASPATSADDTAEPLVLPCWAHTLEETPNLVPVVPLSWSTNEYTITDATTREADAFSITRAGISSVNDFFKGCLILFHRDDEPFYRQWAQVVSYDGATNRIVLDRELTGVPDAGVRVFLSSRPTATKELLDSKPAGLRHVLMANAFNAIPVTIAGTLSRAVFDYQFVTPGLDMQRPAGGTAMTWWDEQFPSMVERYFASLAELGADVEMVHSDLEVFQFPLSASLDFDALRDQPDAGNIEAALGWSLDDLELFAGNGWYTTQRHKQLRWAAWQMRKHGERFNALYQFAIEPYYPEANLTEYEGVLTAAGVYGSRQSFSWAAPLAPKPAISRVNSYRSYADLVTKLWAWSLSSGEGNYIPPPFDQNWTASPAVPAGASSHPRSGWTAFLHDRITVRAMRAASELPTWLWVATPDLAPAIANTEPALWFECIFHNALEIDRLLYYTQADGSSVDLPMQRALDELNQLIGYQYRVPVSFDRVTYGDSYVASGCDAGGRVVWRYTIDPAIEWHTQALPGGNLLLQIGEASVEIAQAQVWQAASPLSNLGVWVLQYSNTPARLSEQQFAQQMVVKYRTLLLRHAGMRQVQMDGQTVTYADLRAAYERWLKRSKSRHRTVTLNLGNA